MLRIRLLPALLLFMTTFGGPGIAAAQEERAEGPTPPRLATMDGDVSFWRPGADDWAPAQVNTALAAGDRLYTGSGGAVGLELAQRAWVRVDADTEISLASLETGYLQLELTSGRAALDLQRLPAGQRVEVDTPNGAFMIDRAGYYRVDVADDTTFTVRRGGEATVVPAGGDDTAVRDGEQVVLTGTDTATLASRRAPSPDGFDQVNEQRVAARPAQARSAQYVAPDVAGAAELDDHGDWRATADYGQVWVPRDTGPDWAPYTTGRWVYDPYYAWTWVDDAPWGWAPYHYGRWVYADSYWGWAPGPIIAQPIYAPALVGFLDAPGVSLSFNVGVPFVSWVALGWGEPCLPWWGPRGFRSRPWWGGWHGPRYVNNHHIDNRRIVNGRDIGRYRNFDARNGVVGARRDQFGRGRNNVRLTRNDIDHLQPIRGTLGLKPTSASLVAREGRGQRSPDRVRNRGVVATRAPQDPSRRLERAGLAAPKERGPQARIVPPGTLTAQRDRAGNQGARNDGRNRQQRLGGAPPPPRAARREQADLFGRPRGQSDDPAVQTRRDVPQREHRANGILDTRRASRGTEPRGDAQVPPRIDRTPPQRTAPRRQASQPPQQRVERQQPQQQRAERWQPPQQRAERRQTPPPRVERQQRAPEGYAPRRADGTYRAPQQRAERSYAPPQQRADRAYSSGGAQVRRGGAEPPRASAMRPEMRSQPQGGGGRGGNGGGDGARRGQRDGGRQREG
jgi:hypothetical protein